MGRETKEPRSSSTIEIAKQNRRISSDDFDLGDGKSTLG